MGLRWLCIAVLALVLPLAASASEQELGEAKVVAKIETDFKPCSEAAGFGYLWVANYGAGSLSRIDPATNTVTGTVRLGLVSQPCGLGVGAGALWVTGYGEAQVLRVDPAALRVVKRIPAGSGVWDVIYAAGSVWATDHVRGVVSRINPRTNRIGARIKTGGAPSNLRFGFGSVWVGSQ